MSSQRIHELRDRALTERARGKIARAAELYRELETCDPDDPQWPHRLADCLDQLGERDDALAALKRAAAGYAARGFVLRALALHKLILRRAPDDRTALDAVVELHQQRRTGLDRFRRRKAGPSPAAETLDAPMHDELEASHAAVPVGPGVYEIPLAAAGDSPPAEATDELEWLATSPLFARLAPASLRLLADAAHLVELPAGEVLYRRGEPPTAMYLVVDGSIKLVPEPSAPKPVAELGPGEVVGVIGMCAAATRPVTAIAREACHVLEIPRAKIETLLQSAPELRPALLDLARQRLLALLLSTHPLFRRLPAPIRRHLAGRFRFFEVVEGAHIVAVGYPPRHLHIVMTGRLEVLGPDGEVIAALGPGTLAAETEFLARTPVALPIVARRRSFVLGLPHDDFIAVAEAYPDFFAAVAHEANAPVWDPAQAS